MRTQEERALVAALAEIRKAKRKKSLSKAQRKYHGSHFVTISGKVKRADGERFKALCEAEKLTRHQVVKMYVERANDLNSVFFWE